MTLKRILFAMVLVTMPTFAAPFVSFTTSGVFNCIGCGGSGGSNVTFGGGTLTFQPGSGTVNLGSFNPTNASLGSIEATGFSSLEMINGTLTLTISQTVPTGDTGNLMATLSGGLEFDGSNG